MLEVYAQISAPFKPSFDVWQWVLASTLLLQSQGKTVFLKGVTRRTIDLGFFRFSGKQDLNVAVISTSALAIEGLALERFFSNACRIIPSKNFDRLCSLKDLLLLLSWSHSDLGSLQARQGKLLVRVFVLSCCPLSKLKDIQVFQD